MSILQKELVADIRANRQVKTPQPGRYWISTLTAFCPRDSVLYYLKYQKEFDDKRLLIFEDGIVVHERLERLGQLFPKTEVVCELKVDDFIISGRADAVDKLDRVWEFKDRPLRPMPEKVEYRHMMQLQFYLNCLDAPEGVVAYIKSFSNIKEFTIARNKAILQKIKERAFLVHQCLKSGAMPPCSCGRCPDVEKVSEDLANRKDIPVPP